MEEDIKILEEIVNKFKNSIKNEGKENYKFFGTMLFYEDIQAIENLITRNKELESKLREHICIEAHEQVKQLYIPKSKVKDMIEEIHNEPMNYSPEEYWLENECKGYCIYKLQELLEERN